MDLPVLQHIQILSHHTLLQFLDDDRLCNLNLYQLLVDPIPVENLFKSFREAGFDEVQP